MKQIKFITRKQFECGLSLLFDHDVRLNSYGNMDVGYADMLITFEDPNHCDRATTLLKKENLSFVVEDV